MNRLTRRDVLKTFAAGGAALVVGSGCCRGGSRVSAGMPDPRDDNEGFTFLHMTDMHVRRKRKGDEGYRACIAQVNALDPLPELSLMGGDLAFDGNYTAKDEFIDQINVYKEISDGLKMPYYNSIGNHDALGWNSRRKVAVDDPDIGKKCIMDRLGMEKSYYSFDHKGWHFAVLDCIYGIETEDGPSYEARIGEEQLH